MEAAVSKNAAARYVLRLYVAGATPRSIRAISNVRRICDEHLEGRHDFEVVDISQHPVVATTEQIFAAPTLIKELPLPARRFVGDMSELDRLLIGLDVRPRAERRPTGSVGHPT
jgi:circadian clock protein KaiB